MRKMEISEEHRIASTELLLSMTRTESHGTLIEELTLIHPQQKGNCNMVSDLIEQFGNYLTFF